MGGSSGRVSSCNRLLLQTGKQRRVCHHSTGQQQKKAPPPFSSAVMRTKPGSKSSLQAAQSCGVGLPLVPLGPSPFLGQAVQPHSVERVAAGQPGRFLQLHSRFTAPARGSQLRPRAGDQRSEHLSLQGFLHMWRAARAADLLAQRGSFASALLCPRRSGGRERHTRTAEGSQVGIGRESSLGGHMGLG